MLVGKTYRQGFYWPIAVCDTDSLVCRCEGCQFVARQKHVISSTPDHTDHLAFLYMGVDLVGPFKKGKGGFTHNFMAVDKFTKWVEVKPATSIISAKVVEFIREIMC
jgi:hypothetical protein